MNKITVYTTSTCPYCVMITDFLKEEGLDFKEVNVETDPGLMQMLVDQTGQMGVPQTKINDDWVIGFDPNRIKSLVK